MGILDKLFGNKRKDSEVKDEGIEKGEITKTRIVKPKIEVQKTEHIEQATTMLELQKIAELVAHRDSASIGTITSFFEEYLENLKYVKYDRSFPEPTHWLIVQTQNSIYDVIKKVIMGVQEKAQATFCVIAVPNDPHGHIERLTLSKFESIACVELDMTENEEMKLLNKVKTGEYNILIADPYRFDSKWHLGSMEEAARLLNKRMKVDLSQKVQVTLFVINPELMTVLQFEQAFNMIDLQQDRNFTRSAFNKEAVMITSVESANENVTLRNKAMEQSGWNVDLLKDNYWDAVHENDINALAWKIQLIPHQHDSSVVWKLLENALKQINALEKIKAKESKRK